MSDKPTVGRIAFGLPEFCTSPRGWFMDYERLQAKCRAQEKEIERLRAENEGYRSRIREFCREAAGLAPQCWHSWDYTQDPPTCEDCGLTATENPCKHESVSPPTFGAWRCNGCNLTFASDPRETEKDNEST